MCFKKVFLVSLYVLRTKHLIEELNGQKSSEAPTHEQRRAHIKSNLAMYRGWCDICITARTTGVPHKTIKQDVQARKDAEKDGPIIYPGYFYESINENQNEY